MLPVALIVVDAVNDPVDVIPAVVKFPPVMLPVATTVPDVVNLVAVMPLATVTLATSTRLLAELPTGVTVNVIELPCAVVVWSSKAVVRICAMATLPTPASVAAVALMRSTSSLAKT